ncbi:MAG: hypothetical protein WAL30_01545 [Candidatus Aquirickettsiella sp.]
MTYRGKFISVWNEIKKFPGFMGKTAHVDQLNDTTAFPWFLNFCKNFSADYRKCKSNRWDYLISIHDFKNSNEFTPENEKDRVDRRNYLINKYNERLLIESNDKDNPWVIDDRDDNGMTLHRKKYLAFEKQLSHIIAAEIEKKRLSNILSEKDIQLEINRLSQLAKLGLLKIYREENIKFSVSLTQDDSYWSAASEQFAALVTLQLPAASILSETKQIKKQQEKIIKELYDHFSKEKKPVKFYSITSIWEKVNEFIIKNKLMQFFSLFWSGFSSHANLLSGISFLFIFFSLSLYSYPIIFLMLGISLAGYLSFHFFYLVKKKSIIFPEIITEQTEHILESVKIAVFNEEKNKKEQALICEIVYALSKKELILDGFFNSISALQENFCRINSPFYIQQSDTKNPTLQKSKLYQYLIEVYPITQFIASMTVNLTSVVLYTYLLTWAMHSILIVLGAAGFAGFIACPIVVGSLILITATFFLVRHLCEFFAREDFYQRFIEQQLTELCNFSFKDENGNQETIQIEKWKKFEYLQEKNSRLKSKFNKFSSLFNNNTFKSEQDKILGASGSFFTKLKKFLNRFFAFSGGGFYGYNLTQQIVWKSNLGLHLTIKILTLPILLIFIPVIIINGITNLITYHYHSRQRNRFEMAKNLDSKLEFLEQTNKTLLYLAALSGQDISQSADLEVNQNINSNSKMHPYLSLPTGNNENNDPAMDCSADLEVDRKVTFTKKYLTNNPYSLYNNTEKNSINCKDPSSEESIKFCNT